MKFIDRILLLSIGLIMVRPLLMAGALNSLEDDGVTLEGAYTGEVVSNLSGGIRQASEYLDNFDLTCTLDAEKLWGWNNTTFFLYLLGNNGGDPSGEDIGVIEAAGLFLNSSHGIGAEYAQSGIMGPSIFPNTSLGIRLRANLRDNLSLQTAVFDGVSGDPENLRRTQIKFGKNDGLLIAAELKF